MRLHVPGAKKFHWAYFTTIINMLLLNFRLGEPVDCAGAVSFLASDESSYITGETIIMSGGMPSRL